jgi:hypothetical protein
MLLNSPQGILSAAASPTGTPGDFTWDPDYLLAPAVLSNSDRTITGNYRISEGRVFITSKDAVPVGKWYLEMSYSGTFSTVQVGIVRGTGRWQGPEVGIFDDDLNDHGVSWFTQGIRGAFGSNTNSYFPTFASSPGRLGLEVEVYANGDVQFWSRHNSTSARTGSGVYTAAQFTGGVYIACNPRYESTVITLDLTEAQQSWTPTAGFSPLAEALVL